MSTPQPGPGRQVPAVAYVPLERLRAHPDNVRRDLGDLRELADSIRRQGILQPLRVEHRPGGQVLRIRAGHRRAAAAELAGLRRVPCVIEAEADTDEAIAEMFAENLHRAGLTMVEKRDNARRLITEFGYTVAGVAVAVGVHQTTVSGWLRSNPARLETRPDRRPQRPGSRRVHVPRVRPTDLHTLLTRWRPVAGGGLDVEAAAALLDEVQGLLGGWTPPETSSTSVSSHVLAQVAELDPRHCRPVRELADRIGCHPKLVERARAALRKSTGSATGVDRAEGRVA
jgi:ParB/RepB/Spo0J family partition protein